MLEPVKIALGGYLAGFYAGLIPTTHALNEYIERGLAKSIAFAPGRMIDSFEEMLASWQRNDTDSQTTKPAKLPVILVAVAKDYTPTGREYTRQVADTEYVIMPGDPKERVFGLRVVAGDIRVQLAFVSADEPTARSLVAQFMLYIDAVPNRRFSAEYTYAGIDTPWPVQLESPEVLASSVQLEAKNLTALIVDITLHASIPLFSSPKDGAPDNDHKGTPGNKADPHGHLVVAVTKGECTEAKP